jgi:hypothetical protein
LSGETPIIEANDMNTKEMAQETIGSTPIGTTRGEVRGTTDLNDLNANWMLT